MCFGFFLFFLLLDLGLESCIEHVWKDTIVYLDSDKPIMIGRAYGRVHRDFLHEELLKRYIVFHAMNQI